MDRRLEESWLIWRVNPRLLQKLLALEETHVEEESATESGEYPPVHIYLGSPPIDTDAPHIEENSATLRKALEDGWEVVPVLLSGCLERAVERKWIRWEDLKAFEARMRAWEAEIHE